MRNLLLLTLGLFVAACGPLLTPAPTPTSAYPDLVITMERGPCYGSCPVYKLVIYGKGVVAYDGEIFVAFEGYQNRQLGPEQIQELVDAIKKANFFSLEAGYSAPVTDMPSVELTITLNGQTKSVYHYGSLTCNGGHDPAPTALCELEEAIDTITNSAQWIGDR